MKLSCAIRAHPDRCHLVEALVDRLGVSDAHVVWDERNDSWDTGRRALLAYDPNVDWHLVVEDDALVCRDLLAGLATALDHLPAESVASLYAGNHGPVSRQLRDFAHRGRRHGWVQALKLVWGVALAVPTASIDDMVAWCDKQRRYHASIYDARLGRYYLTVLRWPAYFTWPCLVEHRPGPSLLGHQDGRHAIRFIGEEASALEWAKETTHD